MRLTEWSFPTRHFASSPSAASKTSSAPATPLRPPSGISHSWLKGVLAEGSDATVNVLQLLIDDTFETAPEGARDRKHRAKIAGEYYNMYRTDDKVKRL